MKKEGFDLDLMNVSDDDEKTPEVSTAKLPSTSDSTSENVMERGEPIAKIDPPQNLQETFTSTNEAFRINSVLESTKKLLK